MSVNNNLQTGSGRIRVAKFTASGSWTAPAGVYSIQALAVGGGGGGGFARNTASSTFSSGGGGGGGGVVDSYFSVVPGTTYTVTIGTGGAGANTTTAAGSNGTDTTFGSLFTAPGGQGGVSCNNGTRISPTSNPGGSMGGWGRQAGSTELPSSGHGHGAATPIILAAYSAASTADFEPTNYSFFNGFSTVTIPAIHDYRTSAETALTILSNTDTNTTSYYNVKRNAKEGLPTKAASYTAGYSWKGLGAGGYSVVSSRGVASAAQDGYLVFREPSAGRCFPFGISAAFPLNDNTFFVNGTSGVANTGAGGGGSGSGGTGGIVASGGAGGSGYVEIVWQE